MDQFMSAAVEMMKATHEEVGCLAYVFSRDEMTPGRVNVFEKWESDVALAAHFEAPHMAEWRAAKDVPDLATILGGSPPPLPPTPPPAP